MEIRVLGTVAVEVGGVAVKLGPRQQRLVFGVLALEADRLVPVERLVDLVWPVSAPRTAEHAIRVCVSRLRSSLAAGGADPSDVAVTARGPGYVLEVDPVRVDAHLFRDLVDRARTAEDADAVGLLDRALGLWRGPALADAAEDRVRDRLCAGLEESRLVAMEDRFDALLRLGGHRDVAAELVALARARPDRERLVGQVMLALHRSGQTGQALDAYRRTREYLREELGIQPGAALRGLEVGILRDDPAVRAPAASVSRSAAVVGAAPPVAAGTAPTATIATTATNSTNATTIRTAVAMVPAASEAVAEKAAAAERPATAENVLRTVPAVSALPAEPAAPTATRHRPHPVPAMLPASISDFTGRAAHLRWLDGMIPDPAVSPTAAMPIAVIAGTAGVGKTALAVRWAHSVRDRFPDGQLYVDLHGYTPGEPVRPQQALSRFLRAAGVPAEQVPVDVVEAAGMFRTLLADRRVLLLLDDVYAAEHVRPLLPASPGCLVVVTSRDRLDGLVARDSARRATLDVLPEPEALALLGRMAGPARVAAEPEAAAGLVHTCARLPLALRITAAHLAARPDRRLADHLADLGRGDLLGQLEIDGDTETAVGAAFDFSYTALKPGARRLFRLMGLVPGADITAPAAAALADVPPAEAARLLDRLAAVHLVDQHRPGRYGMHDLLRRYAAQQAGAEEDARDRAAALDRLADHHLAAVLAPADLLYPVVPRPPVSASTAGVAAGTTAATTPAGVAGGVPPQGA
ncbi:DNA-binding SARP family transcriptional activator [Catenulispora sp. EB89]|uniref:AfsR/SARP family transcriptional regulator n=1 Tax=Catenulispora sp. EB89 TaxID=3156257 RepID=UPI003513A7AC